MDYLFRMPTLEAFFPGGASRVVMKEGKPA